MLAKLAEQVESAATRLDAAERRLEAMDQRHDRTSDQMQATIAFGWDYVAMVRRLGALEDEVARLRADGQRTLPFPDASANRAQAS